MIQLAAGSTLARTATPEKHLAGARARGRLPRPAGEHWPLIKPTRAPLTQESIWSCPRRLPPARPVLVPLPPVAPPRPAPRSRRPCSASSSSPSTPWWSASRCPRSRHDLGGGISGLQWVLDGYTLMFAALLLSAGAVSDRAGARRAYARGMTVFVLASAACGLAPNLGVLVAARLRPGGGRRDDPARLAQRDPRGVPRPGRRARAIGVWTIAGSVAATLGPILGGALSLADWRLIFFINLPIGATALILLSRAPRSPRRDTPFDLTGLITAIAGDRRTHLRGDRSRRTRLRRTRGAHGLRDRDTRALRSSSRPRRVADTRWCRQAWPARAPC